MANDRGKQITNIQRVNIAEITPIEIWDCYVANGILWDYMYKDTFPDVLRSVINKIYQGTAATASEDKIPVQSRGFDSLFISGGGAQNSSIIEAMQELSIPTVVAENPVFSNVVSGQKMLEKKGLEGVSVDVGQSQIKVSCNQINRLFERDFDVVAIRTGQNSSLMDEQLTSFYAYVSASIKSCINVKKPLEAVVLAFPCSISADCGLGGSSYIGMKDNKNMISTIVDLAGLEEEKIFLINDAELSGYTALLDQRLAGFKKTLVLTLGFGVGASIVERRCN